LSAASAQIAFGDKSVNANDAERGDNVRPTGFLDLTNTCFLFRRIAILSNRKKEDGQPMGLPETTSGVTMAEEAQSLLASPLDQRWLDVVVKEMQVVNGLMLIADPVDAPVLLHRLVQRIPARIRPTERQLLRGLLLEFAFRWSRRLHARAHAGQPVACTFDGATFLEDFLQDGTCDARAAFAAWIDRFSTEFLRMHQPSTARHAARRLRETYVRVVSLPALARECRTTPVRLAREFRREFGMTIPQYRSTLRLIEALGRVRDEKVEAVALCVGYRSTKNFYRAFRELTGMTPTDFRRLPAERAGAVLEFAKLALVGHRLTPS
jgi:AraC-like DNA-binding protein